MKQKKQVIIISNENIYSFKPFIKNCENKHRETLFEFIYVTGLNVKNILTASSQELSCDLVEQGFCVMLYNNINQKENLTIYLPQQLSNNQRKYFEDRIANLGNLSLSIYYLDQKNGLVHYNQEKSNIEGLMNLINEKHEYIEINSCKSKIKVLQ